VSALNVNGQLYAVKITVREALHVPSGGLPHKFYDVASAEIRKSPTTVPGLRRVGRNPQGLGSAVASPHPAPGGASFPTIAELAAAFNIAPKPMSKAIPLLFLNRRDPAIARLLARSGS